MHSLRPAGDATPADWVLAAATGRSHDWWETVRWGPPSYDVSLRIAFPSPEERDSWSASGAGRVDPVREAVTTLATQTDTPERCWAAVWEGWCGVDCPIPAPRVPIPHREMLLFTCEITDLVDVPHLAWGGEVAPVHVTQPPHLAWPDDRAWVLAAEVDEDYECSIGCSEDAAAAVERALPGRVRRATYGEDTPLWRGR